MNDYLSKPINPQELLTMVEEYGLKSAKFAEIVGDRGTAGERNIAPDAEGEPPDGAGEPPMDIEASIERAGDREFWLELMSAYFEEADQRMIQLEQAVAEQKAGDIQRSAHSIKGSSAEMLAESVRALAFELETVGSSGELWLAPELFTRLRREYTRLKNFVEIL